MRPRLALSWVLGILTEILMLTQQALSPTEPSPSLFTGLTTSHLSQLSFPSPSSSLPFVTRGWWPLCPVVSSWIWPVRHKQEEESRSQVALSGQGQGSGQTTLSPHPLVHSFWPQCVLSLVYAHLGENMTQRTALSLWSPAGWPHLSRALSPWVITQFSLQP